MRTASGEVGSVRNGLRPAMALDDLLPVAKVTDHVRVAAEGPVVSPIRERQTQDPAGPCLGLTRRWSAVPGPVR